MTHCWGPDECPEQCINTRVQLSHQSRAPQAAAAEGVKELQGEQKERFQERCDLEFSFLNLKTSQVM